MEGVQAIEYFGYAGCVALENGLARAVLGHHCGGRVLEYAWEGQNALFLDPAQAGWMPAPGGATVNPVGGRCDIGPEHAIPRHPTLWIGPWTVEVSGPRQARLTSADDAPTGSHIVRDFTLDATTSRLTFTQTIVNVSSRTTQWCHWSRTFARHGGIAVVPLTSGSRFPRDYVMYGPGPVINFRPEDAHITRQGDYLVISGVPQQPKLGFDSTAGWLAYLMPGDVLFVKRFPVFPDRVYNEVAGLTSCIYYPRERVCEIEPIGPRERLAPGESAAFTEEWSLLPCPFPAPGTAPDVDEIVRLVETTGEGGA